MTKDYIGMTSNTFKDRYGNHNKSFKNAKYSFETELSKYVWELKEEERKYNIKWSVLKRVTAYAHGGKRCTLCIQEKLHIMKCEKKKLLNRRSEFFAKGLHRDKFRAGKFKRAQENKIPHAFIRLSTNPGRKMNIMSIVILMRCNNNKKYGTIERFSKHDMKMTSHTSINK